MTIDLEQFKGHTPGPWVAMPEDQGSVYGDPYCTIDDGTRSIAYVMLTDRARMKPLPEWRANAALMAASPALLSEVRRLKEALEKICDFLLGEDGRPRAMTKSDIAYVHDLARSALSSSLDRRKPEPPDAPK